MVLPVALMMLVYVQPWFPPVELLRDSLAVAQDSDACCSAHFGFISTLGALLLAVTGAVTLFAAAINHALRRPFASVRFLAIAGVATCWLALDDLFLIHELLILELGVPEAGIFAVYAAVCAACLWYCRSILAPRRCLLLLIALIWFGLSVLIDVAIQTQGELESFLEDAAKFCGIAAWSAFYLESAFDITVTRQRRGET
jgi:hypothetical protein